MNFLEQLISTVSPVTGAKRAAARALLSTIGKRRYDGAGKGDRLAGWQAYSTSANAEIGAGLTLLRDRVRDLVRNDAYAQRAVSAITANVIGTGIKCDIQGKADGKVKRLQEAWDAWAGTKKCDADGKLNLAGIQRLACRTIAESGEVLIRRRRRFSADNTVMPFQLQVLEPDHLDMTKDGPVAGTTNRIIQGVEIDPIGRILAYHLYTNHPGDTYIFKDFSSSRVLAEEIIHIYKIDRPGQVRGVPWGAPVVLKIKDFNEYEDAQLIRQKIAACFSGFIYLNNPDALSGLPASANTENKYRVDKFTPGTMSQLNPGEAITFANPPGVENYQEYAVQLLRRIATGYGVPYEVLTSDLSQVNFSSARMGWLEFQRSIDIWREDLFIGTMLSDIWDWFAFAATLKGIITNSEIETYYPKWTPPRREMIDPVSETKATISAIRAGLTSRTRAIREVGYDPEEVTKEIETDNKDLDAKGIILDTDPRQTTLSGQLQVEPTEEVTQPAN